MPPLWLARSSVFSRSALFLLGAGLLVGPRLDAQSFSTLTDRYNGNGNASYQNSPMMGVDYSALAESFTTGSAETSLTDVKLNFLGGSGDGFVLSLYSDSGAGPSSTLVATLNGPTSPGSGISTFTPNGSLTLAANTTYFVVASATYGTEGDFPLVLNYTGSETETGGWTGSTTLYGSDTQSDSFSWNNYGVTPMAFEVDGSAISAVPEPSTYALILGGCALGLAAWRRRPRPFYGTS